MDGQNGGNEPITPVDSGSIDAPISPTPEYNNNTAPMPDAGAGFTPGGAIYSEPDLTVEKDAIPEAISEAPVDTATNTSTPAVTNNAERVASVFANTDATRNMMASATTQSTATGDIRLAPTPRKRMSKLPIIIGAGVIAVLAVVLVVLLLNRGGGNVTQAFTEYYDYAQEIFENGLEDADEDYDEDEEYVDEDEEDEDEDEEDEDSEDGEENEAVWLSNESIIELRKKFDVFKRALDANKSEKADSIREKATTLDQYLKTVEWMIATDETKAEMIELYNSDGEDAVRELLQGMVKDDQEDRDIMDILSERTAYYYAAYMEMYVASKQIGCIRESEVKNDNSETDDDEEDDEEDDIDDVDGDLIDYDCAVKHYKDGEDTIEEQYAKVADTYDLMMNRSSIEVMKQYILKLNNEIKAELEQA